MKESERAHLLIRSARSSVSGARIVTAGLRMTKRIVMAGSLRASAQWPTWLGHLEGPPPERHNGHKLLLWRVRAHPLVISRGPALLVVVCGQAAD